MLVVVCVLGACVGAILLLHYLLSPKILQLKGKHVMITGGSSGIGQALAIEAAKKGANISILARNQTALNAAKEVIQKELLDNVTQKVMAISVDISKDYDVLTSKIQQAEQEIGPVTMLINCAGFSIAGRFEDISLNDFKRLMDVNYFGSVCATKAVVEGMKQRECGRIVFVSSQAGQLGVCGFSGYSASKYALRGLAESLQMEWKPYSIRVTLSFPPDTDTPGYKEELKSKPKETQLISETSGLFKPQQVAHQIIADAQFGRFISSIGLEGYMLSNLTCGMSPVCCVGDAIQQVLTMSIFRLVSFFYLWGFDRVVRKCKEEAKADKSKID
ncbi:hypothetical protein LSH36_348g01013 [Paralvinella palmiformis]|uniref:3-dehydrosphinganine reductase n=1 Tax=Paralvinella palmiformis TaxID=53620 RepID=A0AAD9JFU0_9ANNE|nr:hypothetical protein LSH36_348g01013 [Paralvinella palmiformis]